MPLSSSSTTIQRPDLGQVANEFLDNQIGYIGLEIMPLFPTPLQAADFPIIPMEAILKIPALERAARAAYPRTDWEFKNDTYSTKERGLEEPVDHREAALYERFFDAESFAVVRTLKTILRAQELRISGIVSNTSNAIGNAAASAAWTDASAADPRSDVDAAKLAMRSAGGLLPNTGVLSYLSFSKLISTEAFADQTKYTGSVQMAGNTVQRQMVADWFGLDRILVGNSIYDNEKRGKSTTITDIWSDTKMNLLHLGGNAMDLKDPTFGRTFLWTGETPVNGMIETYMENQNRSTIVRVRHDTAEKVVYTGANYIITGITE